MFTTYILPVLIFILMGAVAGVLLTVVSKAFEVKTDERTEQIAEILPGVNCGACGFSGCADYAAAIVEKGAATNLCRPGGGECAGKISAVMGVAAEAVEPQTAVVHCRGDCSATKEKFTFTGTGSCAAAARFYRGTSSCSYGCIGLGDCAAVCPNGAIEVKDGLASVVAAKCVACGLCIPACPNGLISIRSLKGNIDALCSSRDSGKITRSVCENGCIACRICEKKCPTGAIRVVDSHAVIDHDFCTSCGECAAACPRGVIVPARSCGGEDK